MLVTGNRKGVFFWNWRAKNCCSLAHFCSVLKLMGERMARFDLYMPVY